MVQWLGRCPVTAQAGVQFPLGPLSGSWSSGRGRRPVTAEATGSNPVGLADILARAMPTTNQLIRKGRRRKSKRLKRGVSGSPQLSGTVLRTFILKPRKPNSAERKACRVRLTNGDEVTAHIPGEGHNIQEHSRVLVINGAGVKDLAGVTHRVVRGPGDAAPPTNVDRQQARSKYGTKRV